MIPAQFIREGLQEGRDSINDVRKLIGLEIFNNELYSRKIANLKQWFHFLTSLINEKDVLDKIIDLTTHAEEIICGSFRKDDIAIGVKQGGLLTICAFSFERKPDESYGVNVQFREMLASKLEEVPLQ